MRVRWLLGMVLLAACGPEVTPAPAALAPGEVYRGAGDPFARGALEVSQIDLPQGRFEAPVDLRVHAPRAAGTYPVVLFHHGFLGDRRAYDTMTDHLASHGFVVVAPQLYEADGIPLGKPTTRTEADRALEVLAWAQRAAGAVANVATDPRPPGVAGHSRGGKVVWLVAQSATPVRAIAGVDPVDGSGGPAGDDPPAIAAPLARVPPALIIGFERGPENAGFSACAPAADGFRHFFDGTPAPALLALVLGHGHADMIDEDLASQNTLCPGGPDRDGARRTTGGLMAAHFRLHLQGDDTVRSVLEDAALHPMPTRVEVRR